MKTKNSKISKRQNTYNSKGITLIALVITIIVLIILAGVSIKLVLGENGVITKAKEAKTKTEQAQLNEEIAMNELMEQWEDIEEGNGGSTAKTTNDLKAGDYIKYNTGVASVGENGVITCRVLYEASSQYGLQIISDKNIKQKIDGEDTEIKVELGGSNWATGSASYNSAIESLNNEAENYLNTAYATDARCVGSLPIVNSNGTFTDKDKGTETTVILPLSGWSSYTRPSGWTSDDTGCYDTDTNYTSNGEEGIVRDKETMEALGILTTGEKYWLASRLVFSGSSSCGFYVRCVSASGGLDYYYLCSVVSGGSTYSNSWTNGLRPCFSLRSDITITGGNGTIDSPYTM